MRALNSGTENGVSGMPYLVGDEFCASAFFNPKCCSSDSLLGSGGLWCGRLSKHQNVAMRGTSRTAKRSP